MSRDIFAETRARMAAREAMANGAPTPFSAPLRSGAGEVIVHRCTVVAGQWQASLFVGGEPTGHRGPLAWPDAVRAAYEYGADISR